MNTSYKPYVKSPFQIASKKTSVLVSNPAIDEEVKKHLTSYDFNVTFKEDTQTIAMLKNVSGVVAYICELRRGETVIGYGRGMSVINSMNKYIDKSVKSARNSSFINAVVQSTKVLGGMESISTQTQSYTASKSESSTMITDRQKSYLLELVRKNVDDDDELKQWEEDVENLTKDEASEHINSFLEQSDNNF